MERLENVAGSGTVFLVLWGTSPQEARHWSMSKRTSTMAIYEHITQFAGLTVRDFEPGTPLLPGVNVAYRLGIDYDTYYESQPAAPVVNQSTGLWQKAKTLFGGAGEQPAAPQDDASAFMKLWRQFLADPNAASVEAVVISDWGGAGEGEGPDEVVKALVEAKAQLPMLRALFMGEMTMEESEISWIQQTDLSPLWGAYPGLEHVQVRGGENLSLGDLNLPSLETLILESGGLPAEVVEQICAADLPQLRHLELWLGSDNYGGTTSLDDLAPILSGEVFTGLDYLGLRDCEYADQLAGALSQSPVVAALKSLDLSLGNLSDEGAEALLRSPDLQQLAKLDLHYHFLSDGMSARFENLPIEVDLSDQQEADDDGDEVYRYIAVSE